MLIDFDVHSNYGNWMYNYGVDNDPRDRTYNIKRQFAMYDSIRQLLSAMVKYSLILKTQTNLW